jgi:acylpyruvate hydrolase
VKLATIRTGAGTRAVRLDGDHLVELDAADVGEVLGNERWREWAAAGGGTRHEARDADFAPLVVRPDKVICVGLNYRSHILETGRQPPDHPTLFAKYSQALIGANDPIQLDSVSAAWDWEAELGIVIGRAVRHADVEAATAAIAGFTVFNDVTARDFQSRTLQWLQGKTFEGSSPVGPYLLVRDDGASADAAFEITCEVDGEVMQAAKTNDLVFGPVALVAYISQIITLVPGDIIASGTPGGVGYARDPQRFLQPGNVVVTRIEGVGECRNPCVAAGQPG